MSEVRIKQLVAELLQNQDMTIQQIEKSILKNGFNMKIQGGDEQHGTYAIFQKYHPFSIAITKCQCGHIHYLEDMCIKCNPDWETKNFIPHENIDYGLPF